MKKYFLACLLGIFSLSAWAQNDAGRLSISAVQPEYENIPEEARANLETKMQRLLSDCGLVSTEADRFIMTARVDITTREVNTAGMIVQRMDISVPVYQMDIYPTVMSLLGCEDYYWQGVGTNLLDEADDTNRRLTESEAYRISDIIIRSDYFDSK